MLHGETPRTDDKRARSMFLSLLFFYILSYTRDGEGRWENGEKRQENLCLSAGGGRQRKVVVTIDPKALFIYKNVGGIDGRLYFVSCIDFRFHRDCARTLFCT